MAKLAWKLIFFLNCYFKFYYETYISVSSQIGTRDLLIRVHSHPWRADCIGSIWCNKLRNKVLLKQANCRFPANSSALIFYVHLRHFTTRYLLCPMGQIISFNRKWFLSFVHVATCIHMSINIFSRSKLFIKISISSRTEKQKLSIGGNDFETRFWKRGTEISHRFPTVWEQLREIARILFW